MTADEVLVDGNVVRPLGADTWDAFVRLCERHNGMGFGGCWCTFFHPPRAATKPEVEAGLPYKEWLVREGRAHAALVMDGDEALAWCQYGSVAELPNIYHRKEWEAGLVEEPDYRFTCIFVDKRHRHRGLAGVAVRGALALVAREGGGLVEGYPRDLQPGEQVKAAFLYDATRTLFEQCGFTFERSKGTKNCVMRTRVAPGEPVRVLAADGGGGPS